MENYALIGSILLIHIFAWLNFGPMIALILRNSLVYSRKAGIWTAVGAAIGNFTHIVFAVSGVSLIVSRYPLAHNVIKYLGVGYLVYLGVKTFFAKSQLGKVQTNQKHKEISSFAALQTGLTVNLLSPLAYLFFIGIFGSLISSKVPYWVIIFLVIAMPLNTLMMASLWSLFFSHKNFKAIYSRFQPVFNKCLGILLIILALKVLFTVK